MRGLLHFKIFQRGSEVSEVARVCGAYQEARRREEDERQTRRLAIKHHVAFLLVHGSMAHLLHQMFTMYDQPSSPSLFGCSFRLLDDTIGRVFQLSCNLGIDVGPVGGTELKRKWIKVSLVRRTTYCTMT